MERWRACGIAQHVRARHDDPRKPHERRVPAVDPRLALEVAYVATLVVALVFGWPVIASGGASGEPATLQRIVREGDVVGPLPRTDGVRGLISRQLVQP